MTRPALIGFLLLTIVISTGAVLCLAAQPDASSTRDLVIVIDNSGSMQKNDPHFFTKEVVKKFILGLGEDTRAAMIVFDQKIRLQTSLQNMGASIPKEAFLNQLDQVDFKGQYTDLPAAMEKAIYTLKMEGRKNSQRYVIFLTDGIVDTGDRTEDLEKVKWLKRDLAKESKQLGIKIFGIAFTEKADFQLIQSLAIQTNGEYFRALDAEDIQTIFSRIDEKLHESSSPVALAYDTEQNPQQSTARTLQTKPHSPAISDKSSEELKRNNLSPISWYLLSGGLGLLLIVIAGGAILRRRNRGDADIKALDGREAESSIPKATLVPKNFSEEFEIVHISTNPFVIGRDENCDLRLSAETVSSEHATILFEINYFYLQDLGSTNGTQLNKAKLQTLKKYRLAHGDIIVFDQEAFVFQMAAGRAPGQARTVLRQPLKITETDLHQGAVDVAASDACQQPPWEEATMTGAAVQMTRAKRGMCSLHPDRKATELCSQCKEAYCTECIAERRDKPICSVCSSSPG